MHACMYVCVSTYAYACMQDSVCACPCACLHVCLGMSVDLSAPNQFPSTYPCMLMPRQQPMSLLLPNQWRIPVMAQRACIQQAHVVVVACGEQQMRLVGVGIQARNLGTTFVHARAEYGFGLSRVEAMHLPGRWRHCRMTSPALLIATGELKHWEQAKSELSYS